MESCLIAVVEDDNDQRRNYVSAIEAAGYRTRSYANRPEALEGMQQEPPALAVLDIILQRETNGGFLLCREVLNHYPSMPLIFLTERVDELDKISGLRMGAWDYLPKPISLTYLTERIESLLQIAQLRENGTSKVNAHQGKLMLDEDAIVASWSGQALELTLTEFRLLAYLVRHPGHAVSYERLMGETRQQYVTSNTINTHMRNLRRKFRCLDADFRCITNEYGYGYRWVDQ